MHPTLNWSGSLTKILGDSCLSGSTNSAIQVRALASTLPVSSGLGSDPGSGTGVWTEPGFESLLSLSLLLPSLLGGPGSGLGSPGFTSVIQAWLGHGVSDGLSGGLSYLWQYGGFWIGWGEFCYLLAMTDGISLEGWLRVAEQVLTMWNYLA